MATYAIDLNGNKVLIENSQLSELSKNISGKIITSADKNYDEERKIWNAMIDRKPAFIFQCLTTDDVVKAVKFANRHNLIISVRGGGHNIAGRSLSDDVMLIDLSKMKKIDVDVNNQTVTVSPGATLGDLDSVTQIHGLAVPVGINSTTGVSGLTLGGGFGWISRKYGMTVDNLISANVVTVKGDLITCDSEKYPDLFWAIRGGGGNFGIITSFKFKLNPVGPEMMAGPIVFPISEAKEILNKYNEFCKSAPDELCIWSLIRNLPPFPFVDEVHHGKPVLILVAIYVGSMNEGKKYMDKIAQFGTPLGNAISPHKFADFQKAFDVFLTPGARNYWKTQNYLTLDDDLINILIKSVDSLPSMFSEIFLVQLGGQTNRLASDATAYPHRDIEFVMNVHTRWEDASDDERCINWARDLFKQTLPFATGGAYSNFVSEGDDNAVSAYGLNEQRLREVKAKYDPTNILRSNLNIHPNGNG